MFTGLIEEVGELVDVNEHSNFLKRMTILGPKIAPHLKKGDSVSISGACLTVTSVMDKHFSVDVMKETLAKTKINRLGEKSRVNLERALSLEQRLDGHLVSGHVDEVGEVLSVSEYGIIKELHVRATQEFLTAVAPKGSVTIDGVSLTVVNINDISFSVGVIPTTLNATTLGELRAGDSVNLEKDLIARYVVHFLSSKVQMKNQITWDKLAEYGWGS